MREYMRKYRERKRREREEGCASCGDPNPTVLMDNGKRYCERCAEEIEGMGWAKRIPVPDGEGRTEPSRATERRDDQEPPAPGPRRPRGRR
jgi:hypothetical protein